MNLEKIIKILVVIAVLTVGRFVGHFAIANLVVIGWLSGVVLWQKEGVVTMVAGGVIAGLWALVHFFRPELSVEYLRMYAYWMIGVGFMALIADRYDVVSREFWERVIVEARDWRSTRDKLLQLIRNLYQSFVSVPLNVRVKLLLLVVIFFTTLVFTRIQLLDIFILVFFLYTILFSFDPRVHFVLALGGILLFPLFIIVKNETTAEIVAIHVYYFLVMGICGEVTLIARERWPIMKRLW
jgi:hypothetical protein